ncbi:MAG TPA: hypothetical protein VD970_15480 [Acetobacteraceae bacterium]|nr:hypothetical protein [Acetobacteraceae bacterium]
MSKPRSTEKHGANDGGGPGSSHQGGSHGHAHRDRDHPQAKPGEPTNPDRSRVSGGGGERDRHHAHDREKS